jgi:hypothetical protein
MEEMARMTDLEETLFTDGDYGRLYDSKKGNHTGAMDREDAEKVKRSSGQVSRSNRLTSTLLPNRGK